jgi:O-Antigen ligase
LITAQDTAQGIAINRGAPPIVPAVAKPAAALSERLLLMVLYVTVLASSVAFIEPSPHDALMAVLALACFAAGVRFERHIALLFLLLLVWNIAGLMALLNVPDQQQTLQFAGTSIYLAVAAVLFASLFAHNTMPRIATVRAAYVLTATVVSLAGIAGYFSLFPGAHDLFTEYDRALGAFKDPNVFGPFLIWPALVVIERMLTRSIRITDVLVIGILLDGLLLSFSRGAWIHFAVSCSIMMALTFLTAATDRARLRIFAMSAIGIAAVAAFILILLSFDSISNMFRERAQLFQPYDVGSGGRFRFQEFALGDLLSFPNGMGPFQFNQVHGMQQHNVYLQAFLVYGWAGGMAYLTLLAATLWTALRTVFVRTPWQPYLICAFATFIGEIIEGFVIDTDHWRHFFLLLGMIWGLAAATLNHVRTRRAPLPEGRLLPTGALIESAERR